MADSSDPLVATISHDHEEQELVYRLKWIPWEEGDDFVPIITQNKNGPCPLIALCNVLTFKRRMRIPPGNSTVQSEELAQLLADYILSNKPKALSDVEEANYHQNMQDALSVFPKLHTGIDVNVKFNSVDGFEYTPEIGLFDLVGVSLYHGWVADPQECEMYKIVGPTSYNQLVSIAIGSADERDQTDSPPSEHGAGLAREFLNVTASQLTFHGLSELHHILLEGQFAVFFRNNHFSTIHKHKGVLYELITDMGYLNEHGHVWQSLTDISGDGEYFDSQFRSGKMCAKFETEVKQEDLDREIALGLQHTEDVEMRTPPTTTGDVLPLDDDQLMRQEQEDEDFALACQLQQELDAEREHFSSRPEGPEGPEGPRTPPPQQQKQSQRDSDCTIL